MSVRQELQSQGYNLGIDCGAAHTRDVGTTWTEVREHRIAIGRIVGRLRSCVTAILSLEDARVVLYRSWISWIVIVTSKNRHGDDSGH